MLVVGVGNNMGVLTGKVVLNREEATEQDILVLPEWDDMPKNVKAIILEDMRRVSGDLPMIYGAELASKILREGEYITMDTDTGFVFELQEEIKEYEEPVEKMHEVSLNSELMKDEIETPTLSLDLRATVVEPIEIKPIKIKATKPKAVKKKTKLSDDIKDEKLSIPPRENIQTAIKVYAHMTTAYKDEATYADGYILELPHAADYINGMHSDYRSISSLIYNYVTPFAKNSANVIYSVYDAMPSVYIKNVELLQIQYEAVNKLRNKENFRHLHIAMPRFKSIKQLREFRKVLSAAGLRRSTTLKLYIKVGYSSNIFELAQYLDDKFDGVVIQIDSLYNSLYSTNKKLVRVSDTLISAIEQVHKVCKTAKIPVILDFKGVKMSKSVLQKLSPYINFAVSVLPSYIHDTKQFIYEEEKKRIFK